MIVWGVTDKGWERSIVPECSLKQILTLSHSFVRLEDESKPVSLGSSTLIPRLPNRKAGFYLYIAPLRVYAPTFIIISEMKPKLLLHNLKIFRLFGFKEKVKIQIF